MSEAGKSLLVTRPFPGGQKTVAGLMALGHRPMAVPLFSKRILPLDMPSPFQITATIFTSANSVRALSRDDIEIGHQLLPCFTVGDTTAQAATHAGFTNLLSAKGDVKELIALIEKMELTGNYFYPCAIDRKPDLEDHFRDTGVNIQPNPAYEMIPIKDLPPPVVTQLKQGEIDGVLIYSARAATQFANLCAKHNIEIGDLPFYCLSPSIWATLEAEGAKNGFVAKAPNENTLFELLD
ncbi:uroporphyrinogen-III synthase [Maritalea myrionectae]|uniref:uroporphyrinogen-III synthase n=1 Tax=Maritalea myrionectae TaxID=454601 RepID=UPI00041281C8|nr:uroporphyrinogen-III synthase [Maritalea myrionectae]